MDSWMYGCNVCIEIPCSVCRALVDTKMDVLGGEETRVTSQKSKTYKGCHATNRFSVRKKTFFFNFVDKQFLILIKQEQFNTGLLIVACMCAAYVFTRLAHKEMFL